MNNSIECDYQICKGSPRIGGTRITVYNIISRIYLENDIEIACEDLRITIEEAEKAILYCESLCCINDKSLINFCSGCILRDFFDNGEDIKMFSYLKKKKIDIESQIGSIEEEYCIEEIKIGWLLANLLIKKRGVRPSSWGNI